LGGYRLVDSNELARAGFLSLCEEEFETSAGERCIRWTVEHPGVVAAVPVVHQPEGPSALLVCQFRPALRRMVLEIPAGKLDVPGEDPDAAIVRELAEEIRHRPGRLVKLAEVFNAPDFSNQRTHLYLAVDLEPCEPPGMLEHEEEDMTVQPVPLAEVADLVAAGRLTDARTIIGLLLAQRHLESSPRTPATRPPDWSR
jgi:ADP-ribose pyrophosphatase